MAVMSDRRAEEFLRELRASPDDMGRIKLTLLVESLFQRTCEDLCDIVVGRLVNKGVDAELAREGSTAIEEYMARIKLDIV